MKGKIVLLILILTAAAYVNGYSQTEKPQPYGSITIFPSAPNPCSDKCLIRTYLPENDPFASVRILTADSSLVKEISLATETGISSAPLNVAEMKDGNYLYQLFYKGEVRQTAGFVVKH
jgi:hypothetical protein